MTPCDPMIDDLCRILDVRHPDSDRFEPAFRRAVWAVMAETVVQLGRLNEAMPKMEKMP